MAKFTVRAREVVFLEMEVEAEDVDEALRLAEDDDRDKYHEIDGEGPEIVQIFNQETKKSRYFTDGMMEDADE